MNDIFTMIERYNAFENEILNQVSDLIQELDWTVLDCAICDRSESYCHWCMQEEDNPIAYTTLQVQGVELPTLVEKTDSYYEVAVWQKAPDRFDREMAYSYLQRKLQIGIDDVSDSGDIIEEVSADDSTYLLEIEEVDIIE